MEDLGIKLIYRLQQDDDGAYRELYDSYFKRLHRFAVNFVFDGDVASDIVQAVLVTLYENISRFSSDLNLGAYLGVMVRNRCLNYLRDQGVEDRHKILYLQASEDAGTLEWMEDEELIRRLQAVVEKLPGKYRKICELRFYRNLPYAEIAELLSMSENAAKVQVHRAIQKMKESLASDDFRFIGLLIFYEEF